MTPCPARLEVELNAPGRHFGALWVPHSHDGSAYGRVVVPVVVLNGTPGPTLLLTAGIHGDEYEGQLALRDLAHRLDPGALRGRIIAVPSANPPASLAATRTSPIDGVNLARAFTGQNGATPSWHLALGLEQLLLPLADALVDLHSGGSTLDYLPCGFGRLPDDPDLAVRTLDMMCAFAAPVTALVHRPEASGTFVSAALARGIPAMATELGGGGGVTRRSVAIARAGIDRVLAHLGLRDKADTAADTRLMLVEGAHFLRAPGSGLFDPAFELGETVETGAEAGHLWHPERSDVPPDTLQFAASGTMICRRPKTVCAPGDVLCHLARDITRDALLSL